MEFTDSGLIFTFTILKFLFAKPGFKDFRISSAFDQLQQNPIDLFPVGAVLDHCDGIILFGKSNIKNLDYTFAFIRKKKGYDQEIKTSPNRNPIS